MQLQFTRNEIKAHNKAIVATVKAMNAPEKVIAEIEKALGSQSQYYVKTEAMEARYDDNGFSIIIDESIAVDAANTWEKHAPMIVAAANSLIQAMRLFNQEWVEKVTKKIDTLKVAIKKATNDNEKEEEKDPLENDMLDLLFKDGVSKVSVKMKNGDEKVIRRSLDEDEDLTPEEKIKTWGEL